MDNWCSQVPWTITGTDPGYEDCSVVAVISPDGVISKIMSSKEFAIDTIKLQPFFGEEKSDGEQGQE